MIKRNKGLTTHIYSELKKTTNGTAKEKHHTNQRIKAYITLSICGTLKKYNQNKIELTPSLQLSPFQM